MTHTVWAAKGRAFSCRPQARRGFFRSRPRSLQIIQTYIHTYIHTYIYIYIYIYIINIYIHTYIHIHMSDTQPSLPAMP